MQSIRIALVLALVLAPLVHAAGPLCAGRAPELFPHVPVRSYGAPKHGCAVGVGAQRTFWAWDFSVMPPAFRKVNATCRASGNRGAVFVDDAEWGTHFTGDDLTLITERFEHSTPTGSQDPARGICENVSRTFAAPPVGLDGEPRVVLLFTAMASFNGTSFDGYFNAFDTLTDADAMAQAQQHSNECNVLYLNTRGSPISSDYMLGVISHELSHLVCHPFDAEEESWLDESLGEAAMIACGYPIDVKHLAAFAKKPETPLITTGYVSYGACFLFGTYLLEQLGPAAIGQIVHDPKHGVAGLEATLASAGRVSFKRFYAEWATANLVASSTPCSTALSYHAFPVPELTIREASALPAEDAGELAPYKLRYLKLPTNVPVHVSMAFEPSTAAGRLISVRWKSCGASMDEVLTGGGATSIQQSPAEQALIVVGTEKAGYRLHLEAPTAR